MEITTATLQSENPEVNLSTTENTQTKLSEEQHHVLEELILRLNLARSFSGWSFARGIYTPDSLKIWEEWLSSTNILLQNLESMKDR